MQRWRRDTSGVSRAYGLAGPDSDTDRRGDVPYGKVTRWAADRTAELVRAEKHTRVPAKPDRAWLFIEGCYLSAIAQVSPRSP